MCSQSILQVKLWSWDVWGVLCELFVLWFAITLKKTTQSNQINIFRNFAFGRRNSTQSSVNLLKQNHGLTFYTFHYNNWDVLIYLPRAWAIWIFDISANDNFWFLGFWVPLNPQSRIPDFLLMILIIHTIGNWFLS